MNKRELPELHDYSEDVQELMERMPSKTVRWGLGIIFGLTVAFLVASCFIRCPKYLWVESRVTREYSDSTGGYYTGVAFIEEHDLPKLEEGMPVLYRYTQCEFKGYIASTTPKYDRMMKMKSVELSFGPNEKIYPLFLDKYGLLGRVRLENPTLFERLFVRKKR